ncbi:MAG TPA: hypothetical protein VNM14_24875 [Planctomycetota bacterium]|nr:hypothetical protein [Planctomycetota bacterium]
MMLLTALLALTLAQSSEEALAKKIDSQIPWLSDGVQLIDMELAAGHHPQFPEAHQPDYKADRPALMARARQAAKEQNRLILWYCPRMYGLHMYRAAVTDRYMKVTAFTDPGVVELIRSKFVPLRMCCDAETGKALNLKPFDFVEPGFIVMTPEGKIVHKIDHLRTFNADWFRATLVSVLRRQSEFNRPAGDTVEALLHGGDDEQALPRASADQKALILRRAGKFEDVLKLDGVPLHKGIALLALKRFDEARKTLEPLGDPEAAYHLAAVDLWTGKDPAPRLRALMEKHPASPWAWKAAANVLKSEDTLPQGPLTHHFEDFFYRPGEALPVSTREPAADTDVAVKRAVDFLLRAQWENGEWRDSRYAFWPDEKILPNVWGAVTALSAMALMEWRDVDPKRIDEALRKADAVLRNDGKLNPGRNEEIYALAYRLHYFARLKDVSTLNRLSAKLCALQTSQGFWAHEYPNPFATAVVVHALDAAKKAGADVPGPVFRRASEALMSTRGSGGRQTYNCDGTPPDNEKSSMSRTAICELALQECGTLKMSDVAAGVEAYWKFVDRLEAVRQCDYHSDGRLAGFFYFHAGFHTLEAARAAGGPALASTQKRFRERILAIPEWDGSFVDSHELGKSYGTASALLILSRCR